MSTASAKEIEAEASIWLIRRDSSEWSDEDQAGFDAWLEQSTLHQVAFLRLELGWEEAQRLKALGAGIEGNEPPAPGQWNLGPYFEAPRSRAVRSPRPRWILATAASLLLVVMAAWLFVPAGNAYQTAMGVTTSVHTADGSKIMLNSDSRIRIALTDTERRVELSQGEVFVEVAHDPSRPFVVTVGARRVVAVGTRFSVRREGDGVQVVVTEGKVRVEDAASTKAVVAGGIVHATEAGILVQRRSVPEAEERLGWRSGVLMFRDQTLAEAVAEFNRYNARKLVIDDPAIGQLRIEGNFRATNIDAFARLLEEVYPVDVEATPDDELTIRAR